MSSHVAAVEDFLTCSVCLDTFKEPVSLGCNHSFCTSCLKNYWEKDKTKICPVCRRKSSHEFPPVNFALKQLSLSFQKKQPDTEDSVCTKHPQVPALFCLNENRPLCSLCEFSQHRDHTVVSVEEAVSQLKTQLQLELKPLTEQRKWTLALQQQYEEVRLHCDLQAEDCARSIRKHFETLHQFLQREEELRLTALRKEHNKQLHTIASQLEKVSQLLSTLSKNISSVEQMLERKDMDFISHHSHRSLLSQPTLRLEAGLLINQAKLLGNINFKTWQKMRSHVQSSTVLFNPNTAGSWLYVSDDLRAVRRGETKQQLPDNPERFTNCTVLGSEGWSSGSHQWDVEVGDHPDWNIGLVKESVHRKGEIRGLPENGFWRLALYNGEYYNVVGKKLSLKLRPQKIRVCVDYERGRVGFYDTDDMSEICFYRHTFREKVFPYFVVGKAGDAKTKEIKICPIDFH